MSTSFSTHVAVFAFPFGTHAAPLLQLVQRLAASAPGVRFSFFNTASSNAKICSGTGSNIHEFGNVKVYSVWDGVPEGHVFSSDFVGDSVRLLLEAMPVNIKKGVQEAEAEAGVKVGCLFTDAWYWFVAEMGRCMGVPWVGYWAAGALPLAAHVNTDLILGIINGNYACGSILIIYYPILTRNY